MDCLPPLTLLGWRGWGDDVTRCLRGGTAAVAALLVLAGCTGSPSASASPSVTEAEGTPVAIDSSSPRSSSAAVETSLVESQVRGSRQPVLDALADLGYHCGAENENVGDVPSIICTFDTALENEFVVVFGGADDFRGVGLFTYDEDRLAEFLAVLGTEEISERLMGSILGTIELGQQADSLCPLPCQAISSGGTLGGIEAVTNVGEDLLLFAALQEEGF